MITVNSYNLPDYKIFESLEQYEVFVWQPDKTYLVLGQSNKPESSLFTELVEKDGIRVYKRPSGGETVILSPKMLVIAVLLREETLKNPKIYFEIINKGIIEALLKQGFEKLSQKGISDICIGDKKILGSSIYRNSNKIFYHAVLNVSEDISHISKYIKHPTKEPDYRKGRKHEDFVTSLAEINLFVNTNTIKNELINTIRENFKK